MNNLHWSHGLVLLAVLTACEDTAPVTPSDLCTSGVAWEGGDEESPEMHPGRDCIGCHAIEDEGPRFLAAGTVFSSLDEADDCYGAGGVTVELTGANGAVLRAVTNDAGNFFFETEEVSLLVPFTARLLLDGRERPMATPQSEGACARCHTATGASGAPGRILAP